MSKLEQQRDAERQRVTSQQQAEQEAKEVQRGLAELAAQPSPQPPSRARSPPQPPSRGRTPPPWLGV
eukprot:gene1160-biopygen4851